MPVKPFPFPISLGTDISHIPRIHSIICSHSSATTPTSTSYSHRLRPIPLINPAKRFISKLLTPAEIGQNGVKLRAALRWGELGRKKAQIWRKGRELAITEQMVAGRRGSEHIRGLKGLSRGGRWGRLDKPRMQNEAGRSIAEENGNHQEEKMEVGGQEFVVKIDSLDLMLSLIEEIEAEEAHLKVEVMKSAEFLAGRFAAKEAAIKAHRLCRLTYQDISILHSPAPSKSTNMSSAPVAHIKPENGEWDDAQIVPINISHDGDYATAVCMSYEPTPLSQNLVRRVSRKSIPPSLFFGDKAHSHAIFIRNIPPHIADREFLNMFGAEGNVNGHICRDESARSLGYGWVVYGSEKEALDASKKQVWLERGGLRMSGVWGGNKILREVVERTVGHRTTDMASEGRKEDGLEVRLYFTKRERQNKGSGGALTKGN